MDIEEIRKKGCDMVYEVVESYRTIESGSPVHNLTIKVMPKGEAETFELKLAAIIEEGNENYLGEEILAKLCTIATIMPKP